MITPGVTVVETEVESQGAPAEVEIAHVVAAPPAVTLTVCGGGVAPERAANVMVDGDDTYEAGFVHQLLEPILRGDADMTAASRLTDHEEKSFRPLHTAGNRMVSSIINWMFHAKIGDIFSGYRAFTRAAARLSTDVGQSRTVTVRER